MKRAQEVIGDVIRDARQRRGLTLRDVQRRSGGRLKPSVVGGYERAERSISLARFLDLAAVIGAPADRLLSEVLARMAPDSRREAAIDLNRLSLIEKDERRLLAEFVHQVKARRGDYASDVITLRSGDLEELALAARMKPQTFVTKLRPALIRLGSEEPTPTPR